MNWVFRLRPNLINCLISVISAKQKPTCCLRGQNQPDQYWTRSERSCAQCEAVFICHIVRLELAQLWDTETPELDSAADKTIMWRNQNLWLKVFYQKLQKTIRNGISFFS